MSEDPGASLISLQIDLSRRLSCLSLAPVPYGYTKFNSGDCAWQIYPTVCFGLGVVKNRVCYSVTLAEDHKPLERYLPGVSAQIIGRYTSVQFKSKLWQRKLPRRHFSVPQKITT